ncbi:MAG TPA: DUF4143 domain-containing protein [Candidatus Limnocylindrales bacterium]|nr:DUF4143 domain-containing protein [Candidatus Limnocylindrales bacterium]
MGRTRRPFPRYLAPRLREALRDTPAVLIHGPRQSGKTTLARTVGEPRGYRYVTFDDDAVRNAARADPVIDAKALGADRQLLGPLLETFVLQELRRQASWRSDPIGFHHFRDRDDFEVDIVIEQGHTAVAGIEVKAAATVNESDFRGLRKLRDAAGARFAAGVVLYDGRAVGRFGDGLFAVPVRRLWEST